MKVVDGLRQKVRRGRSWPLFVVAGAFLLGVFTYYDARVFHGVPNVPAMGQSSLADSSTVADPVAPSSMVNAIMKQVGVIPGVNDVAIEPDGDGDGKFLVSAMVDLSVAGSGASASESAQSRMNAAVDQYFQGIFGQAGGGQVSEGMLTFTNGDAIVGTAGLGKAEYQKMAASTMDGNLAEAMLQQPTVQNNSQDDVWYQTQAGE